MILCDVIWLVWPFWPLQFSSSRANAVRKVTDHTSNLTLKFGGINLLVFCHDDVGLFEDGQEYQYSYLTYTTTGVREPEPYGSSFGFRGNLFIQKQPGEAIVKVYSIND